MLGSLAPLLTVTGVLYAEGTVINLAHKSLIDNSLQSH